MDRPVSAHGWVLSWYPVRFGLEINTVMRRIYFLGAAAPHIITRLRRAWEPLGLGPSFAPCARLYDLAHFFVCGGIGCLASLESTESANGTHTDYYTVETRRNGFLFCDCFASRSTHMLCLTDKMTVKAMASYATRLRLGLLSFLSFSLELRYGAVPSRHSLNPCCFEDDVLHDHGGLGGRLLLNAHIL